MEVGGSGSGSSRLKCSRRQVATRQLATLSFLAFNTPHKLIDIALVLTRKNAVFVREDVVDADTPVIEPKRNHTLLSRVPPYYHHLGREAAPQHAALVGLLRCIRVPDANRVVT